MSTELNMDALMPNEMASKAENIGVKKATAPWADLFVLAMLAGAFVALGGLFATTVASGFTQAAWPTGMQRLLSGLVFSLGLILVVVGGAELFTGNNLIVMAWAGRKVSTAKLMRNWAIVYTGNFVGAVGTAALVFIGRQYTFSHGEIGLQALSVANSKGSLEFVQAIALGILCNGLVCLAVWLTYSARTVTDKIAAIIFPVAAFVATGTEHCVANMYFIPLGIMIKFGAPASFWVSIEKTPADFPHINMQDFLLNNLLPVTIGNIIGGALLVGGIYWFVYMRKRPA